LETSDIKKQKNTCLKFEGNAEVKRNRTENPLAVRLCTLYRIETPKSWDHATKLEEEYGQREREQNV
jgi:hypothetical protein